MQLQIAAATWRKERFRLLQNYFVFFIIIVSFVVVVTSFLECFSMYDLPVKR